jgi:hypothetical protein
MIFSAIMVYISMADIEMNLAALTLTWADTGFSAELYYLRFICTLLFGLIGFFGGIISIIGKKFGNMISLIGGILGIAGWFIPLGTITILTSVIPISLSASFTLIDPILTTIGSLLGLLIKK